MQYHDDVHHLRDAYNGSANERNESVLAPWKLTERRRVLDMFRKHNAQRLLEIGAGTGRDAAFFRDGGLDVVCTDLSPEMVRHCRAKGLTAHAMDFLNFDFPQASFDAVYALNCLLHVPKRDLQAVLERVRFVLKPGGLFYVGVYGGRTWEGVAPFDWHDPKRFFSYYTDDDFLAAVAPPFDVIAFERMTVDLQDEYHFQSLMLRKPNRA
jgi:SAM-dependent methyltransferase